METLKKIDNDHALKLVGALIKTFAEKIVHVQKEFQKMNIDPVIFESIILSVAVNHSSDTLKHLQKMSGLDMANLVNQFLSALTTAVYGVNVESCNIEMTNASPSHLTH